MEKQLIELREQQRASWNKFSPGWKKWDDFTMDFLQPYGEAIIEQLDLKDTDVVLDVAAGTGEPGMSIATRVNKGRVIITDLADDMLVIAHDNARRRGIHNVEFSVCDVCDLPFADNMFDAISCRFGFMFFPDLLLATREMVRVLKPGGRIAVAVWAAPEQNRWITGITSVINKRMETTAPPPGSPGLFRCAKEGMIVDLFSQVGLKRIVEKELNEKMKYDTVDQYWALMSEVAAPVANPLSKADEVMKAKIKTEVYEAEHHRYPDGQLWMESCAYIISGMK
jgi:ubiquinone/menaquinone biosynthesis C-methylase UbiE